MRFVDTSFWAALLVPRDAHHEEAKALWQGSRATLLTTCHVIGETWTFLRRRAGHRVAVSFLDATSRSERLVVVHVDEEIERAAFDWLRRHGEREYSFVDATSFEVMRRRRMSEVLAFDEDFAAVGFVEARP
jgi:predicted nucleic acid-binding protein